MLLKPNMVISGASAANRAGPDEVAAKSIACFKRTVPAAVPGIVFLSGGQGDEEATVNLDAINRQASAARAPWELSFSYGRGLQAAPLKAWSGMVRERAQRPAGLLPSGTCHQRRSPGRLHPRRVARGDGRWGMVRHEL